MAAFARLRDEFLEHVELARAAVVALEEERGVAGNLAQAREDGENLDALLSGAREADLAQEIALALHEVGPVDFRLLRRHLTDELALDLVGQLL